MGAHELAHTTWTRWRWRLRGAVMWPTFVVCLCASTAVLHLLPIEGTSTSLGDAFVEAGFLNLAAVAVLGPLLSVALRRQRRDLPRVVALDSAGTAALLLVTAAVLAAGLLHRPTILAAERSFRAQGLALRSYVDAHAPAYRRNLAHADTVQLDTGFYRTCVPADNPVTALCLFIDTSRSPPMVRRDSDSAPNERYFLGRPGDFAVQ
jgi:hypothetical protein